MKASGTDPLGRRRGGLAFPVSKAEISAKAMTSVLAERGEEGLSGMICRHFSDLSTTKRLDSREPDHEV